MAPKKEFIKFTAAGRSMIVIIGKQKYVFTTAEKEKREEIKKVIESFNKLPSENKKTKLIKLLTPKTEAKLLAQKTEKKATKNKIKEKKKTLKELDKQLSETTDTNEVNMDSTVKAVLKGDKRFTIEGKSVYLTPFKIAMPQKLVDKIKDFVIRGVDLKPLINFWKLCLLNPNPIARTKLFDYLSLHNLMVTPNGYFVTYRMVKTTNDPDIFTHAHHKPDNERLYYRVGQVAKLDRTTECDEDGTKDCSRGIHFGSPAFIGIIKETPGHLNEGESTVGEGYGVKITTKAASPSSYGTGYDRPAPPTTQKFSNTFGNQASIWLVNPMHVVSIPFSDTRKMRACEGYFAKLTTPEEVVQHISDEDFLLFDSQYKDYEEEELNKMLKQTKLVSFVDAEKKARTIKAKTIAQEELKQLENKLKVNGDTIGHKDLSMSDINAIIQSRLKKNA